MEPGLEWIVRHGYGAIFLLLMLGIIGIPVPDETLLVFAGYLSSKGTLRLEPTILTAFLGSACGISVAIRRATTGAETATPRTRRSTISGAPSPTENGPALVDR